jgi:hypothetical protein
LLLTTPFIASLSPEAECVTDAHSHLDGGQIGSIWSYRVFFVFDHRLAEEPVHSLETQVSFSSTPLIIIQFLSQIVIKSRVELTVDPASLDLIRKRNYRKKQTGTQHLPPSSLTIHNPNRQKMKMASHSISRKQETTSVSMLKFAVLSV